MPDVIDDRYQVVGVLGEDRLGRTLEVRDQQEAHQPLALQLFWPKYSAAEDFTERLSQCVNTARNILGDHVNRVRNSAATQDGRHYLTADLVQGETLRERLTREEVLQPRHALEITHQLLEALTIGHDKNVVHGEITPGNILLANAEPKTRRNPYGVNVQLVGFGLTELGNVEVAERADTLYLSPEGAQGKHTDARSDVFSVGLICCEMLLGRSVFQSGLGESIREAAMAENSEKLAELLGDLPPGGFDLMSRALAADPENRYPSAARFQRAIEGCAAYQESVRTPVSVEIAIVVLVLFGIAATWFAWNQYGQARESRGQLTRRTEELNARVEELEQGEAVFAARAARGAMARGFDEFLSLVEARRPVDSFALLGVVAAEGGGIPGLRFLTALDRSATAIHEAKEVLDAQVRRHLVGRAKSLLGECDSSRDSFPAEAESWLGYGSGEDAGAGRLERLDRVLASLKRRLEDLESGAPPEVVRPLRPEKDETPPLVAESPDEVWKKLLSAGSEADPSAAFKLAREAQDGLDPRLMELTRKYRDTLKGRVLTGARLNQGALAQEPQLEKWTALLEATPEAGAWQAARDLRLLGYARRFFHEGVDGPFPWPEVYEPPASAANDWRQDFYLRARLVERMPWALQDLERLQVYVRKVGNLRTFLRSESRGPPSQTHCVLVVSYFDESGNQLTSQRLEIRRQGRQYEWEKDRIDLVSDSARLEILEPVNWQGPVPRQAGARVEDLESFGEEFAGLAPLERQCLVFESSGRSLWLSPRFGLVRLVERESVQDLICSRAKE
jgi:hypothetical protein